MAHLDVFLEDGDEGHELGALQAVLVEVLRGAVGRGHHHHTRLEQGREQPLQDHRVRYVRHL